ncbi:hypothetical protein HHK36_018363 [Tetracentron sinense]|uniref:Vacuolar fusion protein MON1 homolog n=1 Tax=Tetracentron sinense TaxID=13715 RepID=A0A835DAS0_TETSI|nr:hypothetical protein HHK36_018363 [Tetracentron sinense]
MASDSNSSTSIEDPPDQNPNPPFVAGDRLEFLTLDESGEVASIQEGFSEVVNGSLNEDYDQRYGSEAEEEGLEVSEEVRESSGKEEFLDLPKKEIQSGSKPVDEGLEVVEEVRESSSSGVVSRDNSELEIDASLSPSSSGYAGEMGSSGSTTASGIEEVDEDDIDEQVVPQDDSVNAASWVPGKRHIDEASGRRINFLEEKEEAFFCVESLWQTDILQVYYQKRKEKRKKELLIQVIFLVKGPIYLVCISCTEERYEALRGQLELIYGQMLLILTKSVNRCFEKNPKFDMKPLLGGTDAVFSSLIHAFSWNPATFLHAYTCLPLAYLTRQAAGAILQDVADSGVLFAILMCKHKVVSLVGAPKASLHPDDMLLLANFVLSSESFRQGLDNSKEPTVNPTTPLDLEPKKSRDDDASKRVLGSYDVCCYSYALTSESFTPICLPRYNPMAFLYAYVHYLDVDTYLMLLTTSSDAFYHLKDCRIRIEMVLLKSNVLSEVQRSILDGGLHVEDLPVDLSPCSGSLSPHLGQDKLTPESPRRFKEAYRGIGGPAGLWHFIYRSIYLDQYVSSEFSSPINSSSQQKRITGYFCCRLYRAYQKLYASMHERGTGPHKTQFRRDENYVLLCWVTQDFELYAAFDPLADKALAIKTCNQVCQWVRDVENEIFLLGASSFSW